MTKAVGEVLTVREVCRYWKKCRSAVRYHIDRGNFITRCTLDNKILIEKASVVAMWGEPLEPVE